MKKQKKSVAAEKVVSKTKAPQTTRRSALPENIIIMKAVPEDVRGINKLLYAVWLSTYPNADYGVTEDDIHHRYSTLLTEERLKKREEEMRIPDKNVLLLVAKDGEKIIAFCRAQKGETNQLNAIYVLQEYQGKGIGKALWKKAKAFFDPSKDILVNVVRYNASAIGFYEKLGFKDVGSYFYDERFKMKSGANMPQMEMVLRME